MTYKLQANHSQSGNLGTTKWVKLWKDYAALPKVQDINGWLRNGMRLSYHIYGGHFFRNGCFPKRYTCYQWRQSFMRAERSIEAGDRQFLRAICGVVAVGLATGGHATFAEATRIMSRIKDKVLLA